MKSDKTDNKYLNRLFIKILFLMGILEMFYRLLKNVLTMKQCIRNTSMHQLECDTL